MAFDLASDVGRQIYRLRTLCLVRAALPSVHSGSLARPQEVGKILLALEADYSRAFEADYSLSAFVVTYFDLYKLGQGLQIQAFDPAASEADYSP